MTATDAENMPCVQLAEWITLPAEMLRNLFADIPQPMRLDDEQIPGRDDLESE